MDFIDDQAAIEEMLRQGDWGTLAVAVDGQPYAVPLNYAYLDGRIVVHGALEGRKLDAIAANPRVCFCIAHQEGPVQDHPDSKTCHVGNWSVLVFGRAQLVTEDERKKRLGNAFNRVFVPEAADLSSARLAQCVLVEIVIEEMTARREVNRKPTYWRYVAK